MSSRKTKKKHKKQPFSGKAKKAQLQAKRSKKLQARKDAEQREQQQQWRQTHTPFAGSTTSTMTPAAPTSVVTSFGGATTNPTQTRMSTYFFREHDIDVQRRRRDAERPLQYQPCRAKRQRPVAIFKETRSVATTKTTTTMEGKGDATAVFHTTTPPCPTVPVATDTCSAATATSAPSAPTTATGASPAPTTTTTPTTTPAPTTTFSHPVRPRWNPTTPAPVHEQNEQVYFDQWSRNMLQHHPHIPPYELNLEVWRQLWRVCEFSQTIMIITDVRCPSFHVPPSLMQELLGTHKHVVIVLNKVDLVTKAHVLDWTRYFHHKYPTVPVVECSSNPPQGMQRSGVVVGGGGGGGCGGWEWWLKTGQAWCG